MKAPSKEEKHAASRASKEEAEDQEEERDGAERNGAEQRARRQSQSTNSYLSSTTTGPSAGTDTKSVSEDIRRLNTSMWSSGVDEGFAAEDDLIVYDGTGKEEQNINAALATAPRELNPQHLASSKFTDFLSMFPDDVILKRLARMRKDMEILEKSWTGYLDRKEAREQMGDNKQSIADDPDDHKYDE